MTVCPIKADVNTFPMFTITKSVPMNKTKNIKSRKIYLSHEQELSPDINTLEDLLQLRQIDKYYSLAFNIKHVAEAGMYKMH